MVLVSAWLYKAARLVTLMLPPIGAAMVAGLAVRNRIMSDMSILRCSAIGVYIYLSLSFSFSLGGNFSNAEFLGVRANDSDLT